MLVEEPITNYSGYQAWHTYIHHIIEIIFTFFLMLMSSKTTPWNRKAHFLSHFFCPRKGFPEICITKFFLVIFGSMIVAMQLLY